MISLSSIIRKSGLPSSSVKIIRPFEMSAAEEAAASLEAPEKAEREIVQEQMQDIYLQQEELNSQKREVNERLSYLESEMKEKAQQMYEEAEREGFHAGFEEGSAQAAQNWKEQIADAASIVELAFTERMHQLEESQTDVLKLAFHLAEKIIGCELKERSFYVDMTKAVLKSRSWTETVTVYASQADYALICSQRNELEEAAGPAAELILLPDPDLDAGGLAIETETSRIDAGADVQLNELKKKLFASRAAIT